MITCLNNTLKKINTPLHVSYKTNMLDKGRSNKDTLKEVYCMIKEQTFILVPYSSASLKQKIEFRLDTLDMCKLKQNRSIRRSTITRKIPNNYYQKNISFCFDLTQK